VFKRRQYGNLELGPPGNFLQETLDRHEQIYYFLVSPRGYLRVAMAPGPCGPGFFLSPKRGIMLRASFYIDGFNLYHSLKGHPKAQYSLWLDLWTLCDALKAPGHTLGGVVYFTALTQYAPAKMKRHQTFLTALENSGVDVVLGRFAPAIRECRECHRLYNSFEEKETDVNLASRMIYDAVKGLVDSVYLMTGDSDQIPAIETIQKLAPKVETVAVFSVNRHLAELKQIADRHIQLSWKHFVRNQFPNPLTLKSGREVHCPQKWLAPDKEAKAAKA
jgi:uncharacterized LabA/DUF88 family protein